MTQALWPPRFEEVLSTHLPLLGGEALDPDANLADLGLDSLALVALLVDVESAFDLTFPDELLTQETFETAGSLWTALHKLMGTP